MRLLIIAAFAVLPFTCLGQDILWEKSLGGKHSEYLFDAQPTADYGFILAGSSLSGKSGGKTEESQGNLDYWIWKMDEKGNPEWQKSFGGSGTDFLKSVRLTYDGGFILAGSSNSPKGEIKTGDCRGGFDVWIIKLNAEGDLQWEKTFGGKGNEDVAKVLQTKDGGYIIGATSDSEADFEKETGSRGSSDYWVIKLDSKGSIEWQRTIGGDRVDRLMALELTTDGGCIAGGWSNSDNVGDKSQKAYGAGDYWVVKLDKRGDIAWQKTFGGDRDDSLQSIVVLKDGGFLIGGNSNSDGGNNKTRTNESGTDFWVLRIDDSGMIVWQETYNIAGTDILASITDNSDGTFLLSGYSKAKGRKKAEKGSDDYVVLKINSKGDELWRKSVGSNGEDVLITSIETRDGGYLLAGTSSGAPSRDRKSGVGRTDFWVVKLKDRDKKRKNAERVEAFPNPATDYTNIVVGYDFEKGTCRVFDLAGHLLSEFKIHSRTVPLNLSGYPEGIYVVQVATNESTDSVKVIKAISNK